MRNVVSQTSKNVARTTLRLALRFLGEKELEDTYVKQGRELAKSVQRQLISLIDWAKEMGGYPFYYEKDLEGLSQYVPL